VRSSVVVHCLLISKTWLSGS